MRFNVESNKERTTQKKVNQEFVKKMSSRAWYEE